MPGRDVPESWRRWKRDPSLPPEPIRFPSPPEMTCGECGALTPDSHADDCPEFGVDFTLPRPWTDPENGVDHTVDGSPAGGPVSGLEAVRDALGSRYPERYRGLNYWAQAQAAAGQAAHPELQIIQEESSQISRWLELYGAAGRHEPWRTVLEANTDVSRTEEGLPVWTTCLRHVTYGGQVCVCTRAAEHELNGDESLEPFHMDVNAGVAWTGPDDVWLCKPPERWRDWWYTGSLDRRSAAVGAGAALLAVLVVLAGIFLP